MKTIGSAVLLTLTLFFANPAHAQQARIPQQNFASETRKAQEKINEASVKKTVSFLASDEMAGRDTPSPELERAAEYVAARFKNAGLSGGATDGGFFQVASIATTSLPTAGIELSVSGSNVKHFGLMGAAEKDFSHDGAITLVDDDESKSRISGPVTFTAGAIHKPSDQLAIARRVSQLKRRGATAVLVQVSPDSPLVATAARNGLPRIINPRERYSIPTLLVEPIVPQASYRIRIPKISFGKTDVRNVIGVLHGSDSKLQHEAIIFSAHLDHIGQQIGLPDPVFNGADDDASGVTAVLTLADAYANLPEPPKRSVIFVTFWGEEKGLLGSKYFVDHPTWPLDKVIANINIEMIGRPEPGATNKCWMTGWTESDLGRLMATGAKQVDVDIFEHPRLSAMLYGASDNASFLKHQVIAHSFSAGSLHSDYHQPGDEWEKLELRHMTQVIRGLFAGSLPIANAQQTPAATGNRENH